MTHKEQWRPIPQYEGLYEISTFGKVRSIALYTNHHTLVMRKSAIMLKQEITVDGYSRVVLCKNGMKKHMAVHRLVALTYIPNPNNLPQVNHKDENPQNNSVDNLEWCTGKQNCNYGLHRQRISQRLNTKHHLSKPVARLDTSGNIIETFKSTREAARKIGVRSENISRCCNGKYKLVCGSKWKYI